MWQQGWFRTIVTIVVAYYTGQNASAWFSTTTGAVAGGTSATVFGGAVGGFVGGVVGSGGYLKAGLYGGLTGAGFGYAGTLGGAGRLATHALVGCASAEMQGGNCGSGAVAQVVSLGITEYTKAEFGNNRVAHFAAATIAGGAASELSGGSFANGARTAAFGYLLNYCLHNKCFTSSDERSFLDRGDYLGYYAKACEGGDPYACQAGEIAKGQSPIAQATTARLQMYAADNLGREFTAAEMNDIRLKLATSYADYLGPSLASGKWPTALDISVIHWQVFGSYGLPPSAFGGTPFGMVPTMIFGPSFYKEYPPPYSGPGWCPKCSKGSLF